VRHYIFEIPDDQADVLVPAIDAGSFPWHELIHGIGRDVGRDYIPTRLSDLSRWGGSKATGDSFTLAGPNESPLVGSGHSHDHGHSSWEGVHVLEARGRVLGLFWTDYRIECDQSLRGTLLAEVLWSEAAHAIDQAMLTDDHRTEIVAALHPEGPDDHPSWWERSDYSAEYGTLPGESFMQIIVEAYTPLTATINLHHEVTPHVIDVARRILTPDLVTPSPFFGLVKSKVFHDTHERVAREVEFATYADAVAAGRRPCRVCKPKEA
jgi:hypothetical protein